jgi:two-component system OmpR family response regulator
MSTKNNIPRRVLLVEDDPETAASLATLLGVAGYQVETVFDGETALETAEAFQPDVCLIDVNLARSDGYELARRIREELEHPPLLANVTPFDERDDWDADAEFDLDFTKPSDPFEIVDQLSSFLRKDCAETRTKVHNVKQGRTRLPEFRRNTFPATASSYFRE